MDSLSLILGFSNLFAGIVVLGLAWPLYQGRISRNHWYGFRTRKSLSSDEVWYATNKYGAKVMLPWAAALTGLGTATLFMPLKGHPGPAILISLAPLGVLIPAIQTAIYCHRLTSGSEETAADRRRRNRRMRRKKK